MPASEIPSYKAQPRSRLSVFFFGGPVRARLLRLALLLLIPGLAISALLIWRNYQADRAQADTALRETARTLDRLVDREFAQAEVLLRTLAATDELAGGDLPAFDRLARGTAIMRGHVVLLDRNGHVLLDTSQPADAPLPPGVPAWAPKDATGGKLMIGALQPDMHGGGPVVPVVLPLVSGGVHQADLALIVPASAFQDILLGQRLPAGWILSILDPDLVLVARSRDVDRFRGHRPKDETRNALLSQGEGIRDGTSLDGVPIAFAFCRSPSTQWTVGVASPSADVAQGAVRDLEVLGGLGSLAIVAGLLGARQVARGIARPIEAAAVAARDLGEGRPLTAIPAGLTEADEVAAALDTAFATLLERREALSDLNRNLSERVEARTWELGRANAALEAQQGRLRSILDHMPVGVLVRSPEAAVLYANPAAVALLGEPKPDRPPIAALQRAVAGERIERELVPLERPEGGRVDVEISAGPVLDRLGHMVLSVTTLQDVSARLEAEEARRRSQRLEAVGQLTGGVAHEFNNLLMALSGALDLMAPHVEGARGQRMLVHARRATERGARLTRQLLAFARKQHLQVEPTDINGLVAGMTELIATTLDRTIEVETRLDPAIPTAMADSAQLELVLLNLAINARDAMPGGGRIVISTRFETVTLQAVGRRPRLEDPPPGDYAVLCLSDTGDGMTPAVLARAFEPFFTTKEVGRGSGLGLAQVLGVAQQLGGGVRIDSVPGEGTSVSVFLPRASPEAGETTRVAPIAAREQVLTDARILLVDDDAEVRDITRGMLEELGAAVTEADGGAAALLLLRTGTPVDLVLVDLTMPVMTGLELAAEINAGGHHLPVVLMSGYSADAMRNEPVSIRATLQKPFRTADLAATLATALGRELADSETAP